MNIHEYQAKNLLKKYGIKVPDGVFSDKVNDLLEKAKSLKTDKFVLKAQIHSGGRGKAGGVKIFDNFKELQNGAMNLMGKILITNQTGPEGRKVNKLYVEEISKIDKELYLACLIDRSSSKIIFISSDQGGMDIEEVAKKNPKKIHTTKINSFNMIKDDECENIVEIFKLEKSEKTKAKDLIKKIYRVFIDNDCSMIEINPLILTKEKDLVCLDAKINFDDNALFKHPQIKLLRDLSEENHTEIEASKFGLSYVKLDGNIGCMVNGAGLAMATMDIIKLYGAEPANFLDVGGGASKDQVSSAFKIILSDKNVKGILINIFGGIMRCDVLANGIISAAMETQINIPLVVRLEGTNSNQGKKILENSKLKIVSASDLSDAAKKIVSLVK
ncbi:MAG: ADP-forming succinate--CoA ligase subunit beta [Candidatus Pelagibacter sp.]|nr:MAG: succinate--CoA ligase subunit beta [Pelagibacteraceae bacterium TMED268]|tara:strand:+ start:1302 stop:2462 length:1161 start_codon:yes stop_codon:yes gene_type:complete